MSQPSSTQGNLIDRFKRILRGETDANARTRVQRRVGSTRPQAATPPSSAETHNLEARYKYLHAFWTVTGVLSLIVNGVLIAFLLILLQILGKTPFQPEDQFAGLLGGLYGNFVKMDEATISTTIPVNAAIPLDIVVPVRTTTRIVLADATTINNAHVVINTGGVDIDADAVVTLPAGTPLNVILDFPLPVKTDPNNNPIQVPIQLSVPVNIPLKDTQLHEPFVGLQEVVKPYYCLVEPNAVWNNIQICSPLANP
ncbi:MAG: hypothetical protein IT314_15130 [Anaerolineales bacterium]|nr:hypothetical protein [Anaerolineales bacterium]